MRLCDVCRFQDAEKGCKYNDNESVAEGDLTIVKRQLRAKQLLETVAETGQLSYIEEGWAYSYRVSEGGERTIGGIYNEGELVGTANLFGLPFGYKVRALTSMSVCLINTDQAIHQMRAHDGYFAYFQKATMRLLWLLANRTFDLSNRTAEERLCRSLVVAGLKIRNALENGAFVFPLTQEMLADQTGTSKVHINRILVGLERDKVCTLRRGVLDIVDRSLLLERASISERELDAMQQVVCDEDDAAEGVQAAE